MLADRYCWTGYWTGLVQFLSQISQAVVLSDLGSLSVHGFVWNLVSDGCFHPSDRHLLVICKIFNGKYFLISFARCGCFLAVFGLLSWSKTLLKSHL